MRGLVIMVLYADNGLGGSVEGCIVKKPPIAGTV